MTEAQLLDFLRPADARLKDAVKRIAELEAQLLHIVKQTETADDPEHPTLDLIKRMALNAITPER